MLIQLIFADFYIIPTILETVRCGKFLFGRDIGQEGRCSTSLCDLDLTFDLAVLTLTFKILPRLHQAIKCKFLLGRDTALGL